MTVQTTIKRADYTGNDVATAFNIPFFFLDETHLRLIKTDTTVTPNVSVDLVLASDYAVAGAGVAAGGTATLTVALPTGFDLAILRNPPLTQLRHYVPNDPFPAASHEGALDLLTTQVQMISEIGDRALVLPPQIGSGVSTELPALVPGYALGVNGAGDAFVMVPNTGADQAVELAAAVADFADTADAAKGDAMIGVHKTGGQATTAHEFHEDRIFNVKTDFGAVGDDTADDSVALQAALDSGGTIFFPDGVYKTTVPLVVKAASATELGGGVKVLCSALGKASIHKTTNTVGSGSNVMRGGTVTDTYAVDSIITVEHPDNGYAYHFSMENILLKGTANAYGIYMPRTAHTVLRSVYIYNCVVGTFTYDTWMSLFDSVISYNADLAASYGFYWKTDGSGGGTGTSCCFNSCWARNVIKGWRIEGLDYSSMNSCGADNINGGSPYAFVSSRVAINGLGAENITLAASGYLIIAASSRITINNMRTFTVTGAAGAQMVYADGATTVFELNNCQFEDFVTVNGAANATIQNGALVVINGTSFPTNGSTFISYSVGAKLVNVSAGTVTDANGTHPHFKSRISVNNGATTSYTYPADTSHVYLATSAASLATTLPATSAATDGLVIELVVDSNVGTATWIAGSGGAGVTLFPAALTANVPTRWIYDFPNNRWLPF